MRGPRLLPSRPIALFAAHLISAARATCAGWCAAHTQVWTVKCATFASCRVCRQCSTLPVAPLAHPSVALVYHGEYWRGTRARHMMDKLGSPKCSDFFSAAHNHHASIIEPLRRMNASVVSVFHTFRSSCAKRDEALVNFLKPMAHVFEDITARGRIVWTTVDAWVAGGCVSCGGCAQSACENKSKKSR